MGCVFSYARLLLVSLLYTILMRLVDLVLSARIVLIHLFFRRRLMQYHDTSLV